MMSIPQFVKKQFGGIGAQVAADVTADAIGYMLGKAGGGIIDYLFDAKNLNSGEDILLQNFYEKGLNTAPSTIDPNLVRDYVAEKTTTITNTIQQKPVNISLSCPAPVVSVDNHVGVAGADISANFIALLNQQMSYMNKGLLQVAEQNLILETISKTLLEILKAKDVSNYIEKERLHASHDLNIAIAHHADALDVICTSATAAIVSMLASLVKACMSSAIGGSEGIWTKAGEWGVTPPRPPSTAGNLGFNEDTMKIIKEVLEELKKSTKISAALKGFFGVKE